MQDQREVPTDDKSSAWPAALFGVFGVLGAIAGSIVGAGLGWAFAWFTEDMWNVHDPLGTGFSVISATALGGFYGGMFLGFYLGSKLRMR